MTYWLGIDCGGTFIKAALFTSDGQQKTLARKSLDILSSRPGYAERAPTALWQACADVIREAIASVDSARIQAVGISAQGKGLFLLDKDNQPLGHGILSSDQRALGIIRKWQNENIPARLYPDTRQALWTGHPVAILRALKENEPERYHKIGSILMSHDYLRFCLTGEIACEETNISESNLYNFKQESYDEAIAATLGIPEITPALPPIIGATQIAGKITAEAAQSTGLIAGTPVVGGLFDVVSTALCAGLTDESALNVVLGTWSVVSGMTEYIDTKQKFPFVYGKSAQPGQYIVHEASPTSAANLEWISNLTGECDYAAINRSIATLPKAGSSVFFIPFLYGSNAGLGMQAGLYGLQSFHTRAYIYQAVYEGVIFSLMTHLKRMQIRFPNAEILRVTGGPAKSAVWMQMLADISAKTVETLQAEETGCLGAALTAMVGLGVYTDIDAARAVLPPTVARYLPESMVMNNYAQKYHRYTQLVEKLCEFNDFINPS